MTPRTLAVALAGAGIAGILLAACSDDEPSSGASGMPDCLAALSPAPTPYPAAFPADWPWPSHTVVSAVEKSPGGGVVLTAHVGSDFEEVLAFMQQDLEDAGFHATQGEAEEDDAEATWTGGGFSGTWAIRSSDDCKGTTLVQVGSMKG